MQTPSAAVHARVCRTGFSLVELVVVVAIIGVLVAISAPQYQRAIEQSRANIAVANLRAIWAAQRLYWLEYQVYAEKSTLESQTCGLLDPNIDLDRTYNYNITSDDHFADHFQAVASPKNENGAWAGQYTITKTGEIEGEVYPPGWSEPIKPLDLR
jgi:prepilin-type N-terminal cleavage/methylation domain-containing protein